MSQFNSIIARTLLLPAVAAALAIGARPAPVTACDKDTLDAARRRSADVSLGAFGQDVQRLHDLHREKIMLAGGQVTARSVGTSSVVITDSDSSDVIEVHIHDGDVKVKLNGEEIPVDRIVHEGDTVKILDKDGKVQKELQIMIGAADGGHAFAFAGGAGGVGGVVAGGDQWTRFFGDVDAPQAVRGAMAAAAGPPPKVMLGVTMTEPGDALESHLKLEPGTTTMIGGLYEGLPAHAAGLSEFDIITKIDGKSPADPAAIRKILAEKEPGSTVLLTVIHEGASPREVTVTVEAYDAGKMTSAKFIGTAAKLRMLGAPRAAQGEGEEVPQAYMRALRELQFAPGPQTFRLAVPQAEMDSESAGKIEQKLQDMEKRMAEMEALIRKLVEEKAKSTRP